jgi:predicted Zn-dependent protease
LGYLFADRATDAIDEFEAALAIEPEDPDLRLLLGLTLIQEGEIGRAAEALYPLGADVPDDGDVQGILALAFFLAGWEEEAWTALTRAEAAEELTDPALVGEVEDALESGDEAVRNLLVGELAPLALRARMTQALR